LELALEYPSSILKEVGDMSDMNGMPSRSGEARLSCLLRSIDLTPQRRAPASDLLGRSRRGSVAAALLLVLLVVAVVSWRTGPAGVASGAREERLEDDADEPARSDRRDERDRRGRSGGRDRD
jgi:hypothetical protein